MDRASPKVPKPNSSRLPSYQDQPVLWSLGLVVLLLAFFSLFNLFSPVKPSDPTGHVSVQFTLPDNMTLPTPPGSPGTTTNMSNSSFPAFPDNTSQSNNSVPSNQSCPEVIIPNPTGYCAQNETYRLFTNPSTGCQYPGCAIFCSDSTPVNNCSINKPLKCANLGLVPDCFNCGCPNGRCQLDGTCLLDLPGGSLTLATTKTSYFTDEPVRLMSPEDLPGDLSDTYRLPSSPIVKLPDFYRSVKMLQPARVGVDKIDLSKLPVKGYIVELNASPLILAKSSGIQAATRPKYPYPSYAEFKLAFNGYAFELTDAQAKQLAKDPAVKAVYKDYPVLAMASPLSSRPPVALLDRSVAEINARNLVLPNGSKLTGKGIKIAIIDTGVDYTHSDLGACTTSQFLNHSCSKVIDGYDFVNRDRDPMDDMGHGTHVAATAAGVGSVPGVAPGAQILAYKVLDSGGSGSTSDILLGIERALDPNQDGIFDDRVDIISMSLGGFSDDVEDPMRVAVNNAVASGVVATIAAGNSGPDASTVCTPGNAPLAITVGAACSDNLLLADPYCSGANPRLALFSSRGPSFQYNKPDVLAPGVLICAARAAGMSGTDCGDSAHVAISGTSMATPHVAGAAALLLEKDRALTPLEIKSLLRSTAVDYGYHPTLQGAGLIDVGAAIARPDRPPIAAFSGLSGVVYR